MNPFPTIKVELGIAATIKAVDKIVRRPQEQFEKKQDEDLIKLRKELEIIHEIITKLEDLFMDILRGFRNEEILGNPEALKAHVNQTRVFLESKRLLHYFEPAIGAVHAARRSPRFQTADYLPMVEQLAHLGKKLDEFRERLGPGGFTGPAVGRLKQLCALAEQQLGGGPPNPNIVETAKRAFEEYDWQLSTDIRKIIGYIKQIS